MQGSDRVIGAMKVTTSVAPRTGVLPGVIIPKLVHGSSIATVVTGNESLDGYDAIITENRTLTIGIKTADCAPVCFADGTRIGIAHVGWRGLCLGLSEKMFDRFDTEHLSVFVGPFLHAFEIRKDFCYDQITGVFGERFIDQKGGTYVFRFKDALASVLPDETVYDERDTGADASLPSHRRGSVEERLVTMVAFA
ncbi:MAG TPA: polyphenol oxidase family protein [Candidatus Paceibacterota bacterium]